MNSAGSNSYDHIPGLYPGRIYHIIPFYNSHCKTSQIVFILGHESRMFGSLSSYKGSLCHNAAVSDTLYYLSYLFGIIPATGYVVQKEKRLASGTCNVINTHGHTVNTHSVVLVHNKSQYHLGSDTICP